MKKPIEHNTEELRQVPIYGPIELNLPPDIIPPDFKLNTQEITGYKLQQRWLIQIGETYEYERKSELDFPVQEKGSIYYPSGDIGWGRWCPAREEWRDIPISSGGKPYAQT